MRPTKNMEWGEDEDLDMTYLQDKELQVGLTEVENEELEHLRQLRLGKKPVSYVGYANGKFLEVE